MHVLDLDWLATTQIDSSFQPIADAKLVILVGVTGVGKTTTVSALRSAGILFDLLPNRRILTDDLIIAHLQQRDGRPVERVRDRTERFALTRRYRDLHAGGMAHALTKLWVRNRRLMLFDGLRGVNEIEHAVSALPNANFLVLDAPHFVRLRRLLGRGDAFDTVSVTNQTTAGHITHLKELQIDGVDRLFTSQEEDQLIQLINRGELPIDELAAKLKIVLTERANYDPEATIQALLRLAPSRTWRFDTSKLTPEEIATQVKQKVDPI